MVLILLMFFLIIGTQSTGSQYGYPKSITTESAIPVGGESTKIVCLYAIIEQMHRANATRGKSIRVLVVKMWSAALICLSLHCFKNSIAAPVMHVWNDREVLPIRELALIHKHEYTHRNFDPPLNVRDDGALFLSVAMVDSEAWINLALNSFVTFAKYQNISGLTIMTTGDDRLGAVFRKLGLFTYDAKATVASYPPEFRLEHPLPSWSWGAIIFLRYNAWFEAFRRGIGFCLVDTDVTFNKDVFFARDKNGHYVDIAIQGDLEAISPKAGLKCK